MALSRNHSSSPKDFLEYMASFKNLNKDVIDIDSSSSDSSGDEVEIVNEFQVTLVNHRCELCSEGEFLIDKLLRFGGLVNEKYRFVCDKCDKNFVFKSELNKHETQCTGPVYEKSNNASHIDEQTSSVINCKVCSKTFKSQGGLTKHMKSQHSGLTHKCELCKMVFSCFQKFRQHCYQHQRARPHYMCNICDKRFRWETTLKKHMKTHDI